MKIILIVAIALLPTWLMANEIVLTAEQNDGFESVWQPRHYYGKSTWGIRGSYQQEGGWMWFNRFPGKSGAYCVSLGVILENDGRSPIRLRQASSEIFALKLPFAHGKKDCERRGRPMRVSLGKLNIEGGKSVGIYGESDYACGYDDGGAYALWYDLRFVSVNSARSCPKTGEIIND